MHEEQPHTVGGNDGCCGVGTTTTEMAMNHSNTQPSHDYKLPIGVIGDNSAVDGVSVNVATGKNSIKKRKSNRTKRDIANGLGGVE